LLLQARVLALQASDLGLQCRTLVRHHLAGPADIAPAALRDLTGAGVEPQHAVGHRIDAVAAVLAIGRRRLRRCDGADKLAAGVHYPPNEHRFGVVIATIVVVAGGRFFQGLWVWNGSVHRLLVFQAASCRISAKRSGISSMTSWPHSSS